MTYQEAKDLVPNAHFIYAGVSQEDIDAYTGDKYISELNGSKILGTMFEVEGLVPLIEGSLSFK